MQKEETVSETREKRESNNNDKSSVKIKVRRGCYGVKSNATVQVALMVV